MGRTKCKTCPDCSQIVSSSCLICVCGGSLGDQSASSSRSLEKQLKRRRTERTKRDKPNFYDSLEYDRQRQKHKEKRQRMQKESESPEKVAGRAQTPPPPHRMQLAVKKVPEEPEVKEEELEEIVLSEEKIAKFSLILDEINRKICAASWKGYF